MCYTQLGSRAPHTMSDKNMIMLCFIAIVTAVILLHGSIANSLPTFAVIFVCMWIIYDYMKTQQSPREINPPENNIDKPEFDLTPEFDPPEPDLNPQRRVDEDIDIKLYKGASIPQLHREMGCSADNQLANRMKFMAMQPKMSKVTRARYNVNTARPFFEAELRANEARNWWDNENDYLDEFM